MDDEGRYMALTLVHERPEQAEDNVNVLPRRVAAIVKMDGKTPWANFIDSVEARAEGRVLLAKLRGRVASEWLAVAFYETLLLHSEPEALN